MEYDVVIKDNEEVLCILIYLQCVLCEKQRSNMLNILPLYKQREVKVCAYISMYVHMYICIYAHIHKNYWDIHKKVLEIGTY